jgi:hypothetical protein
VGSENPESLRYLPISKSDRLELIKQFIDRQFKKEIRKSRAKKAPSNEVADKEYNHRFELQVLTEDQETLYSDRLLKRARRLRVARPAYPKWIDDETDMNRIKTG